MISRSLGNSWLKVLYHLFGADNDEELCITMTHVGLIYTLLVGIYSIFAPAPYGRYQTKVFGPTINAKIGWVVQECMSFFITLIVMFSTRGMGLRNYPNLMAISLFLVHYFHRSFVYPCATSRASKPTPILTVFNAFLFTTYNGFLQSFHLTNVAKIDDWFHIFMVSGTLIFIIGMSINTTHDRILISLRAQSNAEPSPTPKVPDRRATEGTPSPAEILNPEPSPTTEVSEENETESTTNLAQRSDAQISPEVIKVEDMLTMSPVQRSDTQSALEANKTTPANDKYTQKYKIPMGGLFEYVSGANYLGEIIEWIGFALITRKYPQAVFALFTAIFLGIRALHHHKFYKTTFGDDYPKSRKAIIPFIL